MANKTFKRIGGALPFIFNYPNALVTSKSGSDLSRYKLQKKVARQITVASNVKIEVIGAENLPKEDGFCITPNHQANYDIWALVAGIDRKLNFVAKKELGSTPIFKEYLKLVDTYLLDRDDIKQTVRLFNEASKGIVEKKQNIVIFPEGTRSKSPILGEMKSGAFNIAKKAKCPVVPVAIIDSYKPFSDKIKEDSYVVKIVIGKPLTSEEVTNLKTNEISLIVENSIRQLQKQYASPFGKEKLSILGIGDSITFGENSDGKYCGGYAKLIANELDKNNLLIDYRNIAIPTYSSNQIREILKQDNIKQFVSSELNKYASKKLSLEDYNEIVSALPEISTVELIKQANVIVLTSGANDILEAARLRKVNIKKVVEYVKQGSDNNKLLIKEIKAINPECKIVFFGLYFPFPHSEQFKKYDITPLVDKYNSSINAPRKGIYYISTYKEIALSPNLYLPNRRNIHLSLDGYNEYKNMFMKLYFE